MLEKINNILEEVKKAEVIFEDLKWSNENKIISIIKDSDSYMKLDAQCSGDYSCFISVLDDFYIGISYKYKKYLEKQIVTITADGIFFRNTIGNDRLVRERLNFLASEFHENFYKKEH